MFRIQSTLKPRNVSKLLGRWQANRSQSTQTSGSSGGKVLIGATAVVSTGLVGVIGYGAYSDENRKAVEDLIPGSNYVFDTFIGPSSDGVVLSSKQSKPKIPIGLQNGTLDSNKSFNKKEVATKPLNVKTEEKPTKETTINNEPQTPLDVTTTKGTAPVKEDMIIVTPSVEERESKKLTELLQELKKDVNKSITVALSSAEDAVGAIKEHAEQAFKAIDSADEKLFSSISGYADKKAELIKIAEDKIELALEHTEKLKLSITNIVESGKHKAHDELIATEQAIADFNYNIQNIRNIIAEALNDSKAIGEYGELVDAGRKQFAAEVRSLTPDVKLGETSEKLTTEELNLLLAHAHRKVINLQRLLAKHQILEHDSFKQAIHQQRKDELSLLESKIKAELDKQEQLLGLKFKKEIEMNNEEFENELRSQLKRQAAAHSDHLSEVLSVQEKDLDAKWELKLMEEVQTERDQYHRAVAEMRGHVEGLNTALSQRASMDQQAYAARRLWLACESLKAALKQSDEPGKSIDETLIPLSNHVKAIAQASGDDNEFVKTILNSLPTEVLERGIYNESALRERFQKVDRVAKKVAMIGDNGGSLVMYFLSYLQNIFVLDTFESLPVAEEKDKEIVVDNFNTYDILARARYSLDKDDLTQTLKYMNLLRGEPRQVSSDWIKEARLTIETKLIAEVLLIHAAATAVTAL